PDEGQYGLGVGVNSPGYVMARAPVVPTGAGWSMTERRLMWDSTTLAVGGVTTPGYLDLPYTGDQVRTVAALSAEFVGSTITYRETWQNAFGQSFSSMVLMQAKPKKAPLVSLKFITDHPRLYQNDPFSVTEEGNDIARVGAGNPYPTDSPDWERVRKYQIPISQTRSTATVDSKVAVKLKFSVADLADKQVVVEGTSNEGALQFKTDKFWIVNNGDVEVQLVATNSIGDIRVINGDISWTLTVVGDENNPIQMGTSKSHKIFVTFGVPHTRVEGIKPDARKATPARMERAIAVFKKAYENAKDVVKPNEPKPQRIVFEAIKLHKFNFESNFYSDKTGGDFGGGGYSIWKVYDSWTVALRGAQVGIGANCISGASLVSAAAAVVGLQGDIAAKMYAPKSDTDYKVATEWNPAKTQTDRWRNSGKEILGLASGAAFNYFEGTVNYVIDNKEFYFPVGPNFTYRLGNKDDVLRTMNYAGWYTNKKDPYNIGGTYKLVEAKEAYRVLGDADNISVD
ncbi:MAG: hypothetical protein ABGY75_22490, partial [Gemmataceae bacterium]